MNSTSCGVVPYCTPLSDNYTYVGLFYSRRAETIPFGPASAFMVELPRVTVVAGSQGICHANQKHAAMLVIKFRRHDDIGGHLPGWPALAV